MFPPMDRFRADFLALAAAGTAALGRPGPATGQADVWSPRTVPLFGVSYSPDIGLQLGAGLAHTRYGFRALPASTRLIVTAEYATGAERFRARADGEFRRALAPAIVSVEALASEPELIRFCGWPVRGTPLPGMWSNHSASSRWKRRPICRWATPRRRPSRCGRGARPCAAPRPRTKRSTWAEARPSAATPSSGLPEARAPT